MPTFVLLLITWNDLCTVIQVLFRSFHLLILGYVSHHQEVLLFLEDIRKEIGLDYSADQLKDHVWSLLKSGQVQFCKTVKARSIFTLYYINTKRVIPCQNRW